MQTSLLQQYLNTQQGREADDILRRCVHCGFCTATCPTYQLLGDELDGPRGRIYLIKQMLEGQPANASTRLHLDRCLLCRACETTCPSGVRYGRLLEIGRGLVEHNTRRPFREWLARRLLRGVMPHPRRVAVLLRMAGLVRGLLPLSLRKKLVRPGARAAYPATSHTRRMLVLEGCVQSVATPGTNAALARMLDRLGVALVSVAGAGCCGAVSLHLCAEHEALAFMRRNIDAWWPQVETGAEAIIVTASGCGVTVKDYGQLLRHDPAYAAKAARISALCKDPVEILQHEDLGALRLQPRVGPIAFQSPCTLQHGQQLAGAVESVLERAGFTLVPVPDAHLCCGSAGTYSLLQATISQQLLRNKLNALQQGPAKLIATANIGCQVHLASEATLPVKHWLVVIEEAME